MLYVLAMARSLHTKRWVFKGTSASPAPIVRRHDLRVHARAFTCMLCMLQHKIPHKF